VLLFTSLVGQPFISIATIIRKTTTSPETSEIVFLRQEKEDKPEEETAEKPSA
jgi:hypothetical protein